MGGKGGAADPLPDFKKDDVRPYMDCYLLPDAPAYGESQEHRCERDAPDHPSDYDSSHRS